MTEWSKAEAEVSEIQNMLIGTPTSTSLTRMAFRDLLGGCEGLEYIKKVAGKTTVEITPRIRI